MNDNVILTNGPGYETNPSDSRVPDVYWGNWGGTAARNYYWNGYLMGWSSCGHNVTRHCYIDDFTVSTTPLR